MSKFFSLSSLKKKLLIKVFFYVWQYRLLQKLGYEFPKQVKLKNGPESKHNAELTDALRWALKTLGHRNLISKHCLSQALAVQKILLQYKIQSQLKISVATQEEKLSAHAWVFIEDQLYWGGEDLKNVNFLK